MEDHDENDTYGLDHIPNCNLKCRFYENEFPQEGEVVMGRVTRVDQLTGAYVALLEYNHIEALIMFSEFSRKRAKSVHRLMKVGKTEPLLVTKVDEERGFIDLSRKRVNPDDVKACEERYNMHLKVHNIMRQTAAWVEEDLLSLYEKFGWPLNKHFNSLYEAFMISLNEPDQVFSKVDIDEKTKEILLDNISKRMKPVSCKVCSDFEVSCYTFEGIDAVKRSLQESLAKMEEVKDMELTVRLIKSPLYEAATYTPKIQVGIERITELLGHIEKAITDSKGKFKIISQPVAIGAKEEEDIEKMIRELNEQQNDEGSRNGEEDNEEGMNVHLDEYEENMSKSQTTDATENAKQEDSDEDEDDDDN